MSDPMFSGFLSKLKKKKSQLRSIRTEMGILTFNYFLLMALKNTVDTGKPFHIVQY